MRQTWKCRDYSNISEQLKITVESNGDGVASSRRRVYSRISTAFPGFSPRLFTLHRTQTLIRTKRRVLTENFAKSYVFLSQQSWKWGGFKDEVS
jgi:hypothetical protein